jgi:hypothetical protein
MRFIRCDEAGEPHLTEDTICKVLPPYAILSHTWEEGQEVTFGDLIDRFGQNKRGYDKIRLCIEKSRQAGLNHIWIDTCCIDKSNSAELQEAIDPMFRWYSEAQVCFAYLSDVENTGNWRSALRKSRWFTHG